MGEVASAFVTLVPSAKGFGKGISSQIGGDVDSAGKTAGKRFGGGMSSGLAGLGTKVFAPLAAVGAAFAVGSFLTDSIAEARESQKVGALTTQVIKSTGQAAHVTAGQVGDLATAISNKTGIDDEAIQSASNLLLTFTNVRNEVGKGNDIFNQATQAATDMGAALGGDPKSSAIQLGKALNDPVKGVTALSRVGVSFTAQQKKQIKTLVGSGKTLEAQKIILGELNKEFGGAAAASATAGEKFSTTFGNFKEAIGTALLPILDKTLGFLTKFVGGLTTQVGPVFAKIASSIGPVVTAFQSFFAAGGQGQSRLAPLVAFFQTQLLPALTGIINAVRGYISVVLPIVQQFVAGMLARINPMMPQIRLVFSTIGQIITGAMGLIQAVIQRVTTVISFIWSHWGQNIMDFIGKVFGAVLNIVGGALKILAGVIKVITSVIRGDWSGAWNGIKQIVSGAWQAIKGIVSLALNALSGVIRGGAALLKGAMTFVGDKINSALSGLASAMAAKGRELIQGLINGIMDKINAVKEAAGKVAKAIKDFFPGSPVREGPLTSWNNGGAGKRLGGMLADGLTASKAQVRAASSGLAGSVAMDASMASASGQSATGLIQSLQTALERATLNANISAGDVQRAAIVGYRG